MIKKSDKWGKKRHSSIDSYSASHLNTHFSSIATDVDYCKDKIISELIGVLQMNTMGVLQLINFRRNIFV